MIFEKMLTYAYRRGLHAGQIGTSGEALGNFPPAVAHLALTSAAVNLDRALDRWQADRASHGTARHGKVRTRSHGRRRVMAVAGIDLSATEFWGLPLAERAAAFARLRSEPRSQFFEEPTSISSTNRTPRSASRRATRHCQA